MNEEYSHEVKNAGYKSSYKQQKHMKIYQHQKDFLTI